MYTQPTSKQHFSQAFECRAFPTAAAVSLYGSPILLVRGVLP
jgi:hypothetical protein